MAEMVPDQSYYLYGLTNDAGALLGPSGAGWNAIDQSKAAIGFVSTASYGSTSPGFTMQQMRAAKWRADGAEGKGVLLNDDGHGGLGIEAFDPAHELPMGRNQQYRFAETARLCADFDVSLTSQYFFHAMQGNGDRGGGTSDAKYRSEWMEVYNSAVADCATVGLPAPRPLIIATGGQVSTVNSDYYMTQTLYWLARGLGGIIPTWHRIYRALDDIGHIPPDQMVLEGETCAWALEVEERGQPFTIWYSVAKSGLTTTVTFDLLPDETLMDRPDLFDGFGGPATCPNYGFESDAAFASVVPDFEGNTVAITFASAPTWLSLAMQRQDMRAHENGGAWMSGHRTTLFGSVTRPSQVLAGETLYRPVPSIFVRFAGDTVQRMNGAPIT